MMDLEIPYEEFSAEKCFRNFKEQEKIFFRPNFQNFVFAPKIFFHPVDGATWSFHSVETHAY